MKGRHGTRRIEHRSGQQCRQRQQLPFNVLVRCNPTSDVGMFVEIARMDFASLKTLVAKNTPQERGIGLTPEQDQVVDCTARARDGLASGRLMHNDFGQHRIK